MSKFLARIDKGTISFGSDYNRARFKDFVKKNDGIRLEVIPLMPESRKQRGFFEGGVVPMVVYFQDGMDHRNGEDCRRVREFLKLEFNGEFLTIKGKANKVAKSTKGVLNDFLERVMDWMSDQGYPVELLSPNDFKLWRDTIYPAGGPETYLEYLEELGKLKKVNE